MQTLIVGGGGVGSKVAVYLSQRGEDVTVIEEDRKKCEWISKNSDAKVYHGSALDSNLLMEAGVDKVDTLVVALGSDQLTRKVVDFVKKQFGVPRVFAVAKESKQSAQIYSSGADKVICSDDEVLEEIQNVLRSGGNRTLYNDERRGCLISRVALRATSSALGKTVSKLENKSARISGMIRDGKFFFPFEDTVLEMGDELFIVGMREGVEKAVSEIGQE